MVDTYGYASIRIYDIKGRLVETLVEEQLPSGQYEVHWDASDLPSGVYLIRLTGSNKSITKKAVLLK
jgi:flagellar hook assembly protein FlgD